MRRGHILFHRALYHFLINNIEQSDMLEYHRIPPYLITFPVSGYLKPPHRGLQIQLLKFSQTIVVLIIHIEIITALANITFMSEIL